MEDVLLAYANQVAAATGRFKPEMWCNRTLDRLEYFIENDTGTTQRVDEVLTIVRDGENGRPIGFYLKGVRGIYRHINGLGLEDDDGFVDAVQVISAVAGSLVRNHDAVTADGLERMYEAYRDAIKVARRDVPKFKFSQLLDDHAPEAPTPRRGRA